MFGEHSPLTVTSCSPSQDPLMAAARGDAAEPGWLLGWKGKRIWHAHQTVMPQHGVLSHVVHTGHTHTDTQAHAPSWIWGTTPQVYLLNHTIYSVVHSAHHFGLYFVACLLVLFLTGALRYWQCGQVVYFTTTAGYTMSQGEGGVWFDF